MCEKIPELFIALEEIFIHLHPMYGHGIRRGDGLDWIIRPLSYIGRVKKTLAFVGNGLENNTTPEMVKSWNSLMEKADRENGELVVCRMRIMENCKSWPESHWVVKRNKLLES